MVYQFIEYAEYEQNESGKFDVYYKGGIWAKDLTEEEAKERVKSINSVIVNYPEKDFGPEKRY